MSSTHSAPWSATSGPGDGKGEGRTVRFEPRRRRLEKAPEGDRRQQEPVRVGWSTGEGRRGKRILPAADGGLLCGACFCRHPVRLVVVHPLPEQKEAFEEDVAKGKVAPTLSTHVSNFLNKVPNFL